MARVQKTTVDYLTIRTQERPDRALSAFRGLFGDLGPSLALERLKRGKDGFTDAAELKLGGLRVGRVDHGGEHVRGWARFQFEGAGCGWVRDWDAIADVEALAAAEIKRIDIALTTWSGEVSHERIVQAHNAGGFTTRGRPPNLRQQLNSQHGKGLTCYVGERPSDKFGRFYEKGFEMLSQFPESAASEITHIDGFPVEGIYRSEIELKAKTRPIPWEVVERLDEYFAGSYPFCAEILPGVEPDILQRRPERAPQLELAAALAHCRKSYGRVLFTALHAHGGDIGAVWDQIVGEKHSSRLVASGALLVEPAALH